MGIRPHLTTIIGVDNLQVSGRDILDERAKKFASFYGTEEFNDLLYKEIPHYTKEWLKDWQCVDWEGGNKPRKLQYWEPFIYDPEYGLPNVIGCIPPNHWRSMRLSAKDILYVLCDAFGMPGDKPGYEVIKPVNDDRYQWMEKMHGKKLRQQYNHFAYGWLDTDFSLSQRILADLGLEFKIDELQLILYWYWC